MEEVIELTIYNIKNMRNRLAHIKIQKRNNNERYYRPLKYPEIPFSIDDLYIVTTTGDRLDLLANQFYGDVRLWWIITSANMNVIRRDSFSLNAGLELRIPTDISNILDKFEELNNNDTGD